MARKVPAVRDYMTRLPEEVGRADSVGRAVEIMEKHDIHHLPVLEGFHLYGIVSWTDLCKLRIERGEAADDLPLADACMRDVLVVEPVTNVVEAARGMLDRGVGSAVVMEGDLAIGIITKADMLRVLCDVLGAGSTKH